MDLVMKGIADRLEKDGYDVRRVSLSDGWNVDGAKYLAVCDGYRTDGNGTKKSTGYYIRIFFDEKGSEVDNSGWIY